MVGNSNEMEQGYLDGYEDRRESLPEGSNYSASYIHGWLNGRDDRMRKPRAPASVLLAAADKILGGE